MILVLLFSMLALSLLGAGYVYSIEREMDRHEREIRQSLKPKNTTR